MHPQLSGLPAEFVDRLDKSVGRFLRIEALEGSLLPCATVTARELSHSTWSDPVARARESPIGLRVGPLELELVPGELRPPRRAAFSIAAAQCEAAGPVDEDVAELRDVAGCASRYPDARIVGDRHGSTIHASARRAAS